MDVLMGCKGKCHVPQKVCYIFICVSDRSDNYSHSHTEPEKQFALVREHIAQIQLISEFKYSEIVVMVERNL